MWPILLAILARFISYFAMNNDTQNTVYFYAQTDAYSEFSNFAPYGVEFDDRWWRTVEHYFQAMKFHDEAYRERIGSCGRTTSESPQSTGADTNNVTQAICWKAGSVFFPSRAFSMHCRAVDKPKSHCFRPAKNWVAFIGETPHWGLSCSSSV
jgi:hypothetical protein